MRHLFLSIGSVAALCSCAASTSVSHFPSAIRAATREETAVVAAALADPRLLEGWGMNAAPVVIDRTSYDRPVDPNPDNAFYSFTQSRTLHVATSLPALLENEGRVTLSLRDLRVPAGFILARGDWFDGLFQRGHESAWQRFSQRYRNTKRVLSFSSPVIRDDRALIAVQRWPVAPCCGDGYSIYLERTPVGWVVVAYGHFWSA